MRRSCIHYASVSKTKKEKEDLRNQARTYLASCTQYGGSSHEITFLAAYLQFKSNDWTKALATVEALPDVGDLRRSHRSVLISYRRGRSSTCSC